jgi:hypothetical protein
MHGFAFAHVRGVEVVVVVVGVVVVVAANIKETPPNTSISISMIAVECLGTGTEKEGNKTVRKGNKTGMGAARDHTSGGSGARRGCSWRRSSGGGRYMRRI